MYTVVNVIKFGAKGDGEHNDTRAIQAALDSGAREIRIPAGLYNITKPLVIGSDTRLILNPHAHMRLAGGTLKRRGNYFISNRNHAKDGVPDVNIEIRGGIWDANAQNSNRRERTKLADKRSCSGTVMSFKNVNDLTVADISVRDPGGTCIRLCRVSGFRIENIDFTAPPGFFGCDGIRLNGFVENGFIRGIRSDAPCSPDDDLIALNADENCEYSDSFDMESGPIRNISISDIYARECVTFLRIQSVFNEIYNIDVSNVRGGFARSFLEMDASRYLPYYARVIPDDPVWYGEAAGKVRDLRISHVRVHCINDSDAPVETRDYCYIRLETNVKNFVIDDFVRETDLEFSYPENKPVTLSIANIFPSRVVMSGVEDRLLLTNFGRSSDKHMQLYLDQLDQTLSAIEFETMFYTRHVFENGGFGHLEVSCNGSWDVMHQPISTPKK